MKSYIRILGFIFIFSATNANAQLGMPSFDFVFMQTILMTKGCEVYHPKLSSEINKSYADLVRRTSVDWPNNLDNVEQEAIKKQFNKEPTKDHCIKFIQKLNNKELDELVIKSFEIRSGKKK